MRVNKVKYNSIYFYIHQEFKMAINPLNKEVRENIEQMGHLL